MKGPLVNRLRSSLPLLILSSIAACSDGTNPNTALAGEYQATTFLLTRPGSPPVNVLAAGGSMIAGLTEDGTVGANLFIPQSLIDDPQDFEVMLYGRYSRLGNTVHFQHDRGDSVLEDMAWIIGPNTLSATGHDVHGTIEITLTRVEPT
jgi:hypothetical protein